MKAWMIKVQRIGEPVESVKCNAPEIARDYWKKVIEQQPWFDREREQLIVLCLSTKYNVHAFAIVSIGTVNESIAHPRDVFRPAIAHGSYAVIVMHNHPSGDPSPSQSDHSLTRRLSEAGELLQIKVLDHVIVAGEETVATGGSRGYFSFKEAGVL